MSRKNKMISGKFIDTGTIPDKNTKNKKIKKRAIIIICILLFLVIFVLGVAKISANIFISNLNLAREDSILSIEDITYNDKNEQSGEIYIELQKNQEDYSIAYNVNGYETGLYYLDGKMQAFYAFGDQYGKYELSNNNIEGSIMEDDIAKINNFLDVKANLFYPRSVSLAEDAGKIYEIKNNHYLYYFYLDDNNQCTRFEVCDISKDAVEKEIFRVSYLNKDSAEIIFPEALNDGEYEVITGEEFAEASHNFIIGALAASASTDYINKYYTTDDANSESLTN